MCEKFFIKFLTYLFCSYFRREITMVLTGLYCRTLFRDETNGYSLFDLKLSKESVFDGNLIIRCKGIVIGDYVNTPIKVEGTLCSDEKTQWISVHSIIPFLDNKESTISYLSSDLFDGISTKIAENIIKTTGADIFDFVKQDNAKELLTAVKGVSSKKAEMIIKVVKKTTVLKEINDYISNFNGSFYQAQKLYNCYGEQAINMLQKNPYRVGLKIDLDFGMCDTIAKQNGFTADSEERIKAVIMCVLYQCYKSGDVYTYYSRLVKGVNYYISHLSAFPDYQCPYSTIMLYLTELPTISLENPEDENENVRIYTLDALHKEKEAVRNFKRIYDGKITHNHLNIDKIINDTQEHFNITYSDSQKECFKFLRSSGMKIITGGPGTGKSTVINGLIYAYNNLFPEYKIALMAPTGRAAQRVKEITNQHSETIHRSLNIQPYGDEIDCEYNADYEPDLIIIDETSMIDEVMFSLVMKAIKSEATIIFCGDVDQLPSVGAGDVLNDLIKSNLPEIVKLTVNYRQADNSIIADNAYKINNGISELDYSPIFNHIVCKSEEEMQKTIGREFKKRYSKTTDPFKVQILAASRKRENGCNKLNRYIQNLVNKKADVTKNGFYSFRIGDKVMMNQNNYDLKYFNGDIGVVTGYTDCGIEVQVGEKLIVIPKSAITQIELAYACTVHKSQGSEFDSIIIVLPAEPSNMLQRNMLYTAITRAKKEVLIIEQENCLEKATKNTKTRKRNSVLKDKLVKGCVENA